jgi:hypothetical protein
VLTTDSIPTGINSSRLRLIKGGNITTNADESFQGGTTAPVFVSSDDMLIIAYDVTNGFTYYVNNVIVGKATLPAATPFMISGTFCVMTLMQNQTGITAAVSPLNRDAGITDLSVGQYTTASGFQAVPLLFGGNKPIKLKALKGKKISFKVKRARKSKTLRK